MHRRVVTPRFSSVTYVTFFRARQTWTQTKISPNFQVGGAFPLSYPASDFTTTTTTLERELRIELRHGDLERHRFTT